MSAPTGASRPTSRGPFRGIAYVLGVTAFGAGIPTPLYAVYEQRDHFSSAVLAGIFAAYSIGVLATMFLLAPLSDVIGRKPVLHLGMVLTAASGVVFVFASGVLTLALARVVSGLAVGATTSTATASMTGLEPNGDQHHVARVSVAANFGAVATGIFVSGLLVEYGPDPTQLVYAVLIAASVAGIAVVSRTPETVPSALRRVRVRFERPRIPASIRLPFWVAAGALAGCYSIYGFFASLAPSFLRNDLGLSNTAASATIVAVLFAAAATIQIGLGQVRDRNALLDGLPLLVLAIAGVVASVLTGSWPLLVVSAAVLGIGVGYAYMGSVTLIDRTSPPALRGEILSAFFVVGYLALAVPTIGIGLAADRIGLGTAAVVFGSTLALFAAALYFVTRHTPTPPGGEGRPRPAPPGTPERRLEP
ncbi:MAG TPA: MFS transporter [Thermoplasmata archaeon]|nr:MFS transporter [Thermoplasmata archaeon]